MPKYLRSKQAKVIFRLFTKSNYKRLQKSSIIKFANKRLKEGRNKI